MRLARLPEDAFIQPHANFVMIDVKRDVKGVISAMRKFAYTAPQRAARVSKRWLRFERLVSSRGSATSRARQQAMEYFDIPLSHRFLQFGIRVRFFGCPLRLFSCFS